MGTYLGDWALEATLTFLHQALDGSNTPVDFTGTGTYRIYNSSGLMSNGTGNLSVFDDSNTTGLYSGSKSLAAADGYERGQTYYIRVQGTVSAATRGTLYSFTIS